MSIDTTLESLAEHISKKAQADTCDIQDAIKAFDVLVKYRALTKGEEQGDKSTPPGRRSTTISQMRDEIAAASTRGAEDDSE